MCSIIVFSSEEQEIVEAVLLFLEKTSPRKALAVKEQMEALLDLGRGISRYPSVVGTQSLESSTRSLTTLIDRLCGWDDSAELMNLPTKAVLGRGFLVGKINFLSMLLYLAIASEDLMPLSDVLTRILSMNVFTLLSEEVYVSILEDPYIEEPMKRLAGRELAHVWDSRLHSNVEDYAPLLASLWYARKDMKPVFGSMLGMSELYTLSMSLDPQWLSCLMAYKDDSDFLDALEEFLFNLTYEEIQLIRDHIEKRDVKSVGREEIGEILGRPRTYSDFDETDPREMYRFFMQRKKTVSYRRKLPEAAGPRRTLEEHLILYLMNGKR